MTKNSDDERKLVRPTHLRWIRVGDMRVSDIVQRELNLARVASLAANFDPDLLTPPEVSHRDGSYWIINGQHRRAAYIEWIGQGWEEQQIQCWTYSGLTEAQEAELFLNLNNVLAVGAFDKFRIAVEAGRTAETDIDRIVRGAGLMVSRRKTEGAIYAVGTLRKVYDRGPHVLARTLAVVRDAYGQPGLEAAILGGVGLLIARYGDDLDDAKVVRLLGSAHGSVGGLLGRAEVLRKQTGTARDHCVAAAAVEIINRGRGGKKIPSWWAAA